MTIGNPLPTRLSAANLDRLPHDVQIPTYDRGDHIIMSWDIALSEEEKGDYFACIVLLRRKEVFFVLEVIRGRLRFDDLKRKILEVKKRYGAATLLIEDSPISKGLIQSLQELSVNVQRRTLPFAATTRRTQNSRPSLPLSAISQLMMM